MASGIVEVGSLTGTISSSSQLTGVVEQGHTFRGSVGIPEVIENVYTAGDGIVINNKVISIDELILDCGTSTTNV